MDAFKRFRYDFFGELLSQDSDIDDGQGSQPKIDNLSHDNRHNQSQLIENKNDTVPEDSLMEFINDYFQGNITEDFSDSTLQIQRQSSPARVNAFDSYSSSDMNTSIEMFTSPETSAMNMENTMDDTTGESCTSNIQSANQNHERLSRRKSISYDIVFTNSKEKDGKVKIHIVPNKSKTSSPDKIQQKSAENVETWSQSENRSRNKELTIQQENAWLRQRVQDLERKLRCVETESERVVGELSRIIERKNDTISKLELQIAGIRIAT